jgi:hypothetical protein
MPNWKEEWVNRRQHGIQPTRKAATKIMGKSYE